MTRCPFSLSRLVKVTDGQQVVYKAEKQACRALFDSCESYQTTVFDTRFLTQPKLCQELHTFVGNRADSVISLESRVGMPHHSNV